MMAHWSESKLTAEVANLVFTFLANFISSFSVRNSLHVCTDTKHFNYWHIQKCVSTQWLNLMKVTTIARLHDYEFQDTVKFLSTLVRVAACI